MDDIIDHKQNENVIDKSDAFATLKNGVQRWKETMQGWSLLCQWKDRSSKRVTLKDARLSYRVLVAEYAVANRIDGEAAFFVVGTRRIEEARSSYRKGEVKILAANAQK